MADVATAPAEPTAPEAIHPDQPVSIEHNGIELTGVGETEDSLREGLPAPVVPETPAPAKPTKGQRRYSELTSERDQERAKRAAAEAKAAELEQKLAQLAAPQTPDPVREAPAPVSAAAPVSPKFTFPTYDAAVAQNPNLSWDDWNDEKIAARARWEYQQQVQTDIESRIRRGIEADRASRAYADSVEATFKRGRAAYPDFDAVRTNGPGSMIPLAPTPAQVPARYQAIVNSPHSEHLQYAIGSNPDLARRLGQMSDVEFGLALASIAPTAPAASPASTGTAGLVTPPPPMQPVGSGSRTAVPSAVELAERGGEDYDSSGFREQLRRERRR